MMCAVNEAPSPEHTPRALPGMLIGASVLVMPLLILAVGGVAQSLNLGFGLWFTEVFVFLGVSWIVLRVSGRDPVRYPGLQLPRVSTAIYAVVLGAVNLVGVAGPLLILAQQVFPPSWASDSAWVFRDRSPVETALIVSGAIVAAPLGEEYFFRGLFQNALTGARIRIGWAVLITSVAFSAIHGDPVGFAARLELGLLFGWLFWRTGSVWPGMLAHAANNAVTTALWFLQGGGAAEAAAPASREVVVSVALQGALGTAVLAALLRAPARWPALLARRDLEQRPLPATRLSRVGWPWAIGAVVSLVLLFTLDRRGVAVNWAEARHPIPKALPDDAPERRELREMRRRARSGELPVSEYRARLESIGKRHQATPPVPAIRPEIPSRN